MELSLNSMRRFLALSSLLALAACSSWNGQTVNVEMKPRAFTPDPITVTKGTKVCWKNDDELDRWPASNIHPTHEIFSAFDPKMPVAPGETWCFVFSKLGIWKYHDHVEPDLVGTVNVE